MEMSNFDKKDKEMSQLLKKFDEAVETAKAESLVIEDGCSLGTADTWNEVAQLALRIEHIQCWFDAFEDDSFKKEAD